MRLNHQHPLGAFQVPVVDGPRLVRQLVGESALYAEAKMGAMLERIPDKPTTSRRGSRSLPQGIDHKASHYAQQLSRHPEAIQEAIAEAKVRGEVSTRRPL
jgi:hypothetical protein